MSVRILSIFPVAVALLSATNVACNDLAVESASIEGADDEARTRCNVMPSATADEVAATPRADGDLELLAATLSGGVTADQATYDRLVRDVAAIKLAFPEVADISYRAPNNGRSLVLHVDSATATKMESGKYRAWNCLNRRYELQNIEVMRFDNDAFVMVELKGNYNIDELAKEYGQLAKVQSASGNGRIGDGSTIAVTPRTVSGTWHYTFDRGSGDCPAGCINHEYTYFKVDAAGVVREDAPRF